LCYRVDCVVSLILFARTKMTAGRDR